MTVEKKRRTDAFSRRINEVIFDHLNRLNRIAPNESVDRVQSYLGGLDVALLDADDENGLQTLVLRLGNQSSALFVFRIDEFLRDLAAQTKSAWEFERYGSFGLDETDPRPLLVTERLEFPFFDMIHSGFWEPHAIELMRRENIAFDLSRRGLAPLGFRMKTALKTFVFNLCPNLVVRLQNVFNIGKK